VGTTVLGAQASTRSALFRAESAQTRDRFLQRVGARWDELRTLTVDANGKPYVAPSQRIEPVEDGVLFRFEHTITRGPDLSGKVGDWPLHQNEGYLWRDGVLYHFDSGTDDAIVATMRELVVLKEGSQPNQAGFCGPHSFFVGGTQPGSIEISFALPTRPRLTFWVSTTTYPSPEGLQAATPPKGSSIAFSDDENYKRHMHRDTTRRIGPLDGSEWVLGSTERKSERDFKTTVAANWFGKGEANSSVKPAIHLRMSVSFASEKPPSPWGGFPPKSEPGGVGQPEFMAYWNALAGSVRLRPGAL
jgi:Tle cognate immunity protein 4 C-terminal domain